MTNPRRILIAKLGLDGHDRGAKIISRSLRDAGFEVIYTGLHVTPQQVVETAIEEDVAAVGVSLLSGAHLSLLPRVRQLLDERNAEDITLFCGGVIPDADIPVLLEQGVAAVFTPGTPVDDILEWVDRNVPGHSPD